MDLNLRVVVYFEEDLWIAHMIEMDLVGTGDTPESAMEDLKSAFVAQISFCAQKGINPFRMAPPEVTSRWDEASESTLLNSITPYAARRSDTGRHGARTHILSYRDEEVDRLRFSGDFQLA